MIRPTLRLAAAARSSLPPTTLALLPAFPLWLRWHTEGKGGKQYWRGAEWKATTDARRPIGVG